MKNLKSRLENNKINNLSITLNQANLQNILFALSYTYKWDDEADKWKRAEYESLYLSLYKEASKIFGKEELEDLGIEDDIENVQTRY